MKSHCVEQASAKKRRSGQKSVFCCIFLGYDIVERGKGQLMF